MPVWETIVSNLDQTLDSLRARASGDFLVQVTGLDSKIRAVEAALNASSSRLTVPVEDAIREASAAARRIGSASDSVAQAQLKIIADILSRDVVDFSARWTAGKEAIHSLADLDFQRKLDGAEAQLDKALDLLSAEGETSLREAEARKQRGIGSVQVELGRDAGRAAEALGSLAPSLKDTTWEAIGLKTGQAWDSLFSSNLFSRLPGREELLAHLGNLNFTSSPGLGGLVAGAAGGSAVGGAVSSPISAALAPATDFVRYKVQGQFPVKIPGPGDVVRFAVREMFNPTLSASKVVDPDRPDVHHSLHQEIFGFDRYYELMRENGYSTEFANQWWGSHWELPGAQTLFEMMHRLRPGKLGVSNPITEAEVRRTLVELDVDPRFVDRLMEISYLPLTRVDIRRMRKLGVLVSREEVRDRYRDIGYSQTDSELQADFVERVVDPEESALSKSEILAGYKEDLISREAAYNELLSIGLGPERTILILSLADSKKERSRKNLQDKEKKDDLRTVRDVKARLKAGLLPRAEAEVLLLDLQISPDDVAKVLGPST